MRVLRLGQGVDASIESDRIVNRSCQLDITQHGDGVIYYSNRDEIRRLVPK